MGRGVSKISLLEVKVGRKRPRRWVGRQKAIYQFIRVDRTFEFWYLPHRGFYPLGTVTVVEGRREVWKYTPWRLTMKRRVAASGGEGKEPISHLAAMESTTLEGHFNLIEHCASLRYDDGKPRTPGWITIKTMGNQWVVQVKDPDGCCGLQCLAPLLDDALAAADLLLSTHDAPWEHDEFLQRKADDKKKKK